jgi:hypothetical protein
MHLLRVVEAVLDRVILQRQPQLIAHEIDIPLDRLGRHLDLFGQCGAVRITGRSHHFVDLQHPAHGGTAGSRANDLGGSGTLRLWFPTGRCFGHLNEHRCRMLNCHPTIVPPLCEYAGVILFAHALIRSHSSPHSGK